MTRLLKESLIEFQQKEKPELPEAKFKGRHIFVGDTNWGNLDPILTLGSTSFISKEDLLEELIHTCGLFNAAMIPFARKCEYDNRVLRDTEGNVIMDFSSVGVETTFGWKRYGDDYTLAYFEEFNDSTTRPGDYIRPWLLEEYQNLQGQRLISAQREEFLPVEAKLITLLSRVTGKENDVKYRREFIVVIAAISSRRPIRWVGVISDALRHQVAYFGSLKTFYMNYYLV